MNAHVPLGRETTRQPSSGVGPGGLARFKGMHEAKWEKSHCARSSFYREIPAFVAVSGKSCGDCLQWPIQCVLALALAPSRPLLLGNFFGVSSASSRLKPTFLSPLLLCSCPTTLVALSASRLFPAPSNSSSDDRPAAFHFGTEETSNGPFAPHRV
jgi:hypothetical protein